MNNLRNFCIISHIDHGKSTLADRFLEITKTIPESKMRAQFLDKMDLEREKGITIKMQPIRMLYHLADQEYTLNLIDTPGHVDFSYEVSRALAACEGAVLLVDAQKGVQAQTLANLYVAQKAKLKIIPVVNKIDLPGARPEVAAAQISKLLQVDQDEVLFISAKTGQGVEKLLEKIIQEIPAPQIQNQETRALIFDAIFDEYRGVISYVRVFDGELNPTTAVKFLFTDYSAKIEEVGYFAYQLEKTNKLVAGEIGYVIAGLRDLSKSKIGDTIAAADSFGNYPPALLGYKEPQAKVFASFYPVDGEAFTKLKGALGKLKLNDSSLIFEPETSLSFGFGFRCGFLGLLHLEITKERLEREFALDLVVTTPSTIYKYKNLQGQEIFLKNPALLPENFQEIQEPWIKLEIIAPSEYLGVLMNFLKNYRNQYLNTEYLEGEKIILSYELPLAEIMTDFYDRMKSVTSGFASMNYEIVEWRTEDLVKLEIDIAQKPVDAFSQIIPRTFASKVGKSLVEKLKGLIPRQLFEIKLQARVGGKILASESIPPLRKDVLAKLYGGDRTRKDKLLKKQAAGKKKMKQLGKVEIPKDLFLKFYQN